MRADQLEAFVNAARITLEHTARHGSDFAPIITVMRDGEVVAQVLTPLTDGAVPGFARVAASGFRADELLLTVDAWSLTDTDGLRSNPVTGARWQPGDLAELAADHDGVARGWVTEAITMALAARTGDRRLVSLPYRRLTGGKVEWGERLDGAGLVGRLVVDVFDMPVVPDDADLSTARAMTAAGCTVMLS